MIISVAVGVIQNSNREILLAQRKPNSHQAGKWEFAGGKIEPGETSRHALTRELYEELGIEVQRAVPLIRIHHTYSEYSVILDVWRVLEYSGSLHGKENQAIKWVPIGSLTECEFPAANHPIVTAIRLPSYYVLIPELNRDTLFSYLEMILKKNYSLIRFRANGWNETDYLAMLPDAIKLCQEYGAELIIDGKPEWVEQFGAAGLHLTSRQLNEYSARPISKNKWLGVSCHNIEELNRAKKLDPDFAVLAPILPTPSHPHSNVLGWSHFSHLVQTVNFPVYALGGMELSSPAIWFGAQGVAGIRLFISAPRLV